MRLNRIDESVSLILGALGEDTYRARVITREVRDGQEFALGGGSRVERDDDGEIFVYRVDDVVPVDRDVGVIHLDVEGYEANVLTGAQATIARCRPLIILETAVDVPGYKPVRKVHSNTVFMPVE
jgi:FkbM family methyltransferase